MKVFVSCLVICVVTFISCKKENLELGEVSVRLSATTNYKNGSEETRFERSGTINRSSYAQLVNDGVSNKLLVNLGAAGMAPNLSTFGVSFLFNQETVPDSIAGTYSFPKDQLLVKATLRNEVTSIISETIFYPTRGKASFTYDSSARVINGSVEDLEFNIIPNDAFNRYRVTIKGTFKNIPVR